MKNKLCHFMLLELRLFTYNEHPPFISSLKSIGKICFIKVVQNELWFSEKKSTWDSPEEPFCQFLLNSVSCFWKRRWRCVKFTTTTATMIFSTWIVITFSIGSPRLNLSQKICIRNLTSYFFPVLNVRLYWASQEKHQCIFQS